MCKARYPCRELALPKGDNAIIPLFFWYTIRGVSDCIINEQRPIIYLVSNPDAENEIRPPDYSSHREVAPIYMKEYQIQIIYRTIPCQHCSVELQRPLQVRKATCFDCKIKIRKEKDLTRRLQRLFARPLSKRTNGWLRHRPASSE